MKKKRTAIRSLIALTGGAFVVLCLAAKIKKKDSVYDNDPGQKNPLEGREVIFVDNDNDPENADGIKGHLEDVGVAIQRKNYYQQYVKRGMDIALSFVGLVVLGPIIGAIALAITIDDPGPIFFTQKRIGQNKQYFKLHKFRSMKMSTPHDVPTHMLGDPNSYITRVGRFLRAHSLDELPQIWDIFIGNMSVIGPRPALWNQDVLTAEREKYGVNELRPGLTGWAQINGRDELELQEKAAFDGEYAEQIRKGGLEALAFDCKCFIGTIILVASGDGVVEGGTGAMHGFLRQGVPNDDPESVFGCDIELQPDRNALKRVLITGAGSYIGESVKAYASENYHNLKIDTLDMIDGSWRDADFSQYDSIYHVAGLAHADVGNVSDEIKEKYYAVNTDLAIETASKAKKEGVKQFIFMSSMIVYGESAPLGKDKLIDRNTCPAPANFYGDSKWQADRGVRALADDGFKVAVLRPPMIYGKGSKGNYPILAKMAKKLPVFPDARNKRSMLYIGNLCEFVCNLIMTGEGGIFFPQNAEYTQTSDMVGKIAKVSEKPILITKAFNPAVRLASYMPGKISGLVNKAFGNNCYDQNLSTYSFEYQKVSLEQSIQETEGSENQKKKTDKKHILLISQYFYPETFRVNDIAQEWIKRGYKVTVLTGIPNYPMGRFYDGYGYTKKRREIWHGVEIIRIPLIARGNSSNKIFNAAGMAANYLSFVATGHKWVRENNIGADLVFTVEVSPMTQALIGIWYGKRYGVPSYLYVQDLWPENVETVTGIHNKALIGPIGRMVDKIYRETDVIFTTSPSFVKAITDREIKVPESKVHYWPQYAEEFYRPMPRQKVNQILDDDSYKIAFTGNIGTAQGLEILPKTAALLKDEDVTFVIVGDGRYQPELEFQIGILGVKNKFIMVPRVQAQKVPEILSVCDAGFISFNNMPLWHMTIPAKLQSYMACGKPIIASAAGETERIISEAECGICCRIGDAVALADGIKKLMAADNDRLGKNAEKYFHEHFDKAALMDEMDKYIESVKQ